MSKLFNLREWLTIEETSKHLSLILGENISEADLYRLALDGHIQLSMDFVNKTYGKLGKIVGKEEIEYIEIPSEVLPKLISKNMPNDMPETINIPKSLCIDKDHFMNFSNEISVIDGIWDLMMLGDERIDVEHIYQQLTGGPDVTLINIDGAFVRKDDVVFHLMESFDDNEYQKGSEAVKYKIDRHINENNVSDGEAKRILEKYDLDRKEYLANRKSLPSDEDYYPRAGLPDDGVLVIRTSSILNFLRLVEQPVSDVNKDVSTKERYTFLVMIASLCDEANIDINKRGIAAVIAKLTENIGAPISDDTIRPLLKQMNDALDSRQN